MANLTKRYGEVIAVAGIDLEVAPGEFFTLLGPSGSGKTTTLRMIAGFEDPTSGTVELAGEDVGGVPPYDRAVNTVFQDYALFPHMSVGENVAYGLRVAGVDKAEHARRRDEALEMVRLPGYGDRKPGELSGGQRQRVALARAIVNRPGLFTVIVGHATFCIVVVYNNVLARLRRVSISFEEASADLGAHTWQTFRFVTLPSLRTALAAGGLLAFALSFDEIIVTTFTIGAGQETLPIWIFRNLFRPNQLPIVNVVAVLVVLISIVPVYLAHRLTREEGAPTAGRGGATAMP